jgi:hypothetical protein
MGGFHQAAPLIQRNQNDGLTSATGNDDRLTVRDGFVPDTGKTLACFCV